VNRRMFLGRFLGGVGVAALGAGAAKALVKSPDLGQPLATIRANDTPEKAIQAEQWPTTHWWERPVEWLGDPLDHNRPLSWWATGPLFSESEYRDAMEFHHGLQWPLDVLEMRTRQGRATLVINKIASIIDRAIAVSHERGEPIELTDADWRRVFVNAYRRNKDAQLHFNTLISSQAEMMNAYRLKKFFLDKAWETHEQQYGCAVGTGYISLVYAAQARVDNNA
jgi:hypothetical protein